MAALALTGGRPAPDRPPRLTLQLLGPRDVGVAKVQWEQRLHLTAPACAGRTVLSGDP
jgi:hypothetical protein